MKKADFPLESVILLIAALVMLITGVLLFPVSRGALPYYENGLFGLLLVMFSLQIMTMGKTPFGDMGRSKPLLAAGVVSAALGIITCFVPDIFRHIPRLLVVICLGPGSLLLLLQMALAREKLRLWVGYGGIFRHLIAGSFLVYLLSMLFALIIWKESMLKTPVAAVVALVHGVALVYLALVLRVIYGKWPQAEQPLRGDAGLATDHALLLLMSVFMLLLGLLLIPVSLGLLPFSGSAQLGLMMVLFAVQMVASGSTPIGAFPRSWLMILLGLVCAALGIVSCSVPEILVHPLTYLVGVLNVLGGVLTLWKICIPRLGKGGSPEPPVLKKLFAVQVTMNLLTILFGTSVFVSGLIPGHIIGVILAANGCVLFYMLHLLLLLDKMQNSPPAAA
jgi:hypothetical protein